MMTHPEVPVNTSQSNLRILWLPAFLCLLLLSIEIYFLVHDWDSMTHPKQVQQSEAIAIYVSGKNNVRQKSVGTLIWKEPIVNMQLFRESEIATTDNSEAVIRFSDQSELIVEPNSLLILEEAPTALKTGSDKIVARLVRGSMKRKNSGANPFFVKMSTAQDAAPVQIKDTQGSSVFRVIYRAEGYEIVVESGSVVVDQKDTVKAGEQMKQGEAPKLSAPILKKPKVNVVQPHSSLWNWFIPNAEAAESKISIQFEWEPTPDAKQYLIQIANDPEFSDILLETKIPGLEYNFEMVAPQKKSVLYFHVAGISESGAIGNFSALASVDVNPVETPKPKATPAKPMFAGEPTPVPTPAAKIKPAPTPEPKPVAEKKTEEKKIEEKKEPVEEYVPPVFVNTGNTTWLWYGVQLTSRIYKSSTNPKETSASGFTPSVIGFEFQHAREPGHYYSLGGSFIYESAKAKLPAPSDKSFSTSQFNLWFTYGQLFDWWKHPQTWHFGPYLATSKKITENGLTFGSENIFLAGVMAAIQSDPAVFKRGGDFAWRAQLAVLFVGSTGVDLAAWIRKPLPIFSQSGAFWGVKLDTRLTSAETHFGGALQVGLEL